MKAFVVVMGAFLVGSCATQSVGYKRLPERLLSIDPSTAAETFVLEVSPAFQEPIGFRFEFFERPTPHALKTRYFYREAPAQTQLSAGEAKRIRAALLAFDWNRVEDPEGPDVVRIVPDDIGILFRARLGGVYHEVVTGLSRSSSIERLLRDLEVFE